MDGPGRNVVLRQLPSDAFARLQPHLEEVDLELKHLIYEPDGPVRAIYFPLTAVISLVAVLGDGEMVEAATVGYEGVTGIPAVLGSGVSPYRVLAQVSGKAVKMRWLLMTHDRVESDGFPMTQEFLAQMLGVQRPTVNIAGSTLQKAGFIRYTRGHINVVDRRGLETAACECYAHLVKQLQRAFPNGATSRAR